VAAAATLVQIVCHHHERPRVKSSYAYASKFYNISGIELCSAGEGYAGVNAAAIVLSSRECFLTRYSATT